MYSQNKKQSRQSNRTAWKMSDGKYRRREKTGAMTGYRASHEEERTGAAPKSIADYENAYGTISSGVDKKGTLTLLTTRHRRTDMPTVTNDEKQLESSRAIKKRPARGTFLTSNLNQQKSAFAYQETAKQTPYFMLRRLKSQIQKTKSEVIEQMLPFLDQSPEQEALAKTPRDAAHAAERQALQGELAQKRREEHRFLKSLERTVQEARQKTASTERVPPWQNWMDALLEEEENEENAENSPDSEEKPANL